MDRRYKKAKNGLIAHIYEHITGDFIVNYMLDHGMFYVTDFNTWPKIYGDVGYYLSVTYSKEAEKLLKKAYLAFDKSEFSYGQIKRMAGEIAVENHRLLVKVDRSIFKELEELHKMSWKDISSLPVNILLERNHVIFLHKTSYIQFGEENKKYFSTVLIKFSINKKFYESHPAKKVLAILLLEAMSYNLAHYLRQCYIGYYRKSEFKNDGNNVVNKTKLEFLKSDMPSKDELQKVCNTFLESLTKDSETGYNNFIIHVKNLLKESYKNPKNQCFDTYDMYELSGGIVMGYEGWKSVADEGIIKDLLLGIKIEIDYQ